MLLNFSDRRGDRGVFQFGMGILHFDNKSAFSLQAGDEFWRFVFHGNVAGELLEATFFLDWKI